jgi:hypothetical protein
MALLKQRWVLIAIGAVLGAVGGYTYYSLVGCEGGCLIWSSPLISVGYGALLGGLTLNLVKTESSAS